MCGRVCDCMSVNLLLLAHAPFPLSPAISVCVPLVYTLCPSVLLHSSLPLSSKTVVLLILQKPSCTHSFAFASHFFAGAGLSLKSMSSNPQHAFISKAWHASTRSTPRAAPRPALLACRASASCWPHPWQVEEEGGGGGSRLCGVVTGRRAGSGGQAGAPPACFWGGVGWGGMAFLLFSSCHLFLHPQTISFPSYGFLFSSFAFSCSFSFLPPSLPPSCLPHLPTWV